jgi:hypothetical protein
VVKLSSLSVGSVRFFFFNRIKTLAHSYFPVAIFFFNTKSPFDFSFIQYQIYRYVGHIRLCICRYHVYVYCLLHHLKLSAAGVILAININIDCDSLSAFAASSNSPWFAFSKYAVSTSSGDVGWHEIRLNEVKAEGQCVFS